MTTPVPPVLPPDDDAGDSAETDRKASYGAAPDESADPGADEELSVDADREAATGTRPETG